MLSVRILQAEAYPGFLVLGAVVGVWLGLQGSGCFLWQLTLFLPGSNYSHV